MSLEPEISAETRVHDRQGNTFAIATSNQGQARVHVAGATRGQFERDQGRARAHGGLPWLMELEVEVVLPYDMVKAIHRDRMPVTIDEHHNMILVSAREERNGTCVCVFRQLEVRR